MSTWQKINVFLNRIIPVITPTSVIFGIIFADYLHPYTYLVPWIFAFMTFRQFKIDLNRSPGPCPSIPMIVAPCPSCDYAVVGFIIRPLVLRGCVYDYGACTGDSRQGLQALSGDNLQGNSPSLCLSS